ncbi:unnamed protein product [Peniophora sp. CBMAI 1063]|nr:unnamed protein product [Peniophora sp. CBMAI 1063]
MNNSSLAAANRPDTRASINDVLSDDIFCEIFLMLAFLDIPTLERPQGWFLQVNGVCRRWRYIAVGYAELWAASAGSFLSGNMTDLAISRAGDSLLRFDGHFEDHDGPGHVLTGYQFSLIETQRHRLRSLVYDDYFEWADLLYRLRTFPKLEMARLWDGAGPDAWERDEFIDAPNLHGLYLNNVLIPFLAPNLGYLRVDMDHQDWNSLDRIFEPDKVVLEGCDAIPRVFPTREFIAFLTRYPLLERLIIIDMPLLREEDLPSTTELHVKLSRLQVLHLGGMSMAMGDFLERLYLPHDVQILIDTEVIEGADECEPVLLNALQERFRSPVYDSLRISRTSTYELLLQVWSSESKARYAPGGLDLATSLGMTPFQRGPALTVRLPGVTRDILELGASNELEKPLNVWEIADRGPVLKVIPYMTKVADMFYDRAVSILNMDSPWPEPFSTLRYLDYTDAPWDGSYAHVNGFAPRVEPGRRDCTVSHMIIKACSATHLTANWLLLSRVEADYIQGYHLTEDVEEVTIVNFPCAAFPDRKRYDERTNAKAWDKLQSCLELRHEAGWPRISLRLAESYSDMSNMARSNESVYEHTIEAPYEDAVRAVTQKGYERVAPYLRSFEDLRIHTLP